MTSPPRYSELSPAQREAFDARYGKPSLATVAAVAVATQKARTATVNGVTLGPGSPLREKPTRTRRQDEHQQQVAFFQAVDADPALRDLPIFAVPNGGHRHPATAARLKAEGVRSGVPDICVAVARGDCHALYIEMKSGRNKPSENQVAWIKRLARHGYLSVICYSADEALRELRDYLALPPWEDTHHP